MFSEIGDILAPLFVVTGIGWAWGRSGRKFDSAFAGDMALLIGAPAIAFSGLVKAQIPLAHLGEMAAAWACCMLSVALVGGMIVKLLGWPVQSSLPCILFPNTGNVGLPLAIFAFGEQGLAYGAALFAIGMVLNQSIAPWLYSGTGSLKPMLRLPALYATAAAILCLATGFNPPVWVFRTLDVMAGILVPMMMMALGVALSRLKVTDFRRSLGLAAMRVGFGYCAGVGVAWAFGLSGPARGVLVIQAAMPLAVFNYLFAQLYRSNPEVVAGAVVMSTVISFVTLPLLLWTVL
jgi:predicted permease